MTNDLVDIEMQIRAQDRLGFDVILQLQGDELHMGVGAFWLKWSPCTVAGGRSLSRGRRRPPVR
jgi:hypothetical protein